jgi:dienelactone hydrolase
LDLSVATYFARPDNNSSENAIIIFSDVFGIYENSQLVADKLAARGYLTIIPDLFKGDAIPVEAFFGGKTNLQEWLTHHLPSDVDPIVKTVIEYLRTVLKVKNIGGVGYCYGGRVRRCPTFTI